MLRIGIIVGSTRPGRKAEAVADWIFEMASLKGGAEFEIVDKKGTIRLYTPTRMSESELSRKIDEVLAD